jgi:hypothetical protein
LRGVDRRVTLWLSELNEVFSGQLLDQTFQFELQKCR